MTFVSERFHLNRDTVDNVKKINPPFGFNGFGASVFARTYSRRLDNGRQERWSDTILRVTEGVFSIRKDWYKKKGIHWDESYWQAFSKSFAEYMAQMKFLPPGRGLFTTGTEHLYNKGNAAANNCGFVDIKDETFAEDICWAFDFLMLGVGIGYSAYPGPGPKVDKPDPESILTYEIPDTRQGWIESQRLLIESYLRRSSVNNKIVAFDYSKIRKAGEPIKGFGGTASGPDPLKKLHERTRKYLEYYQQGDINGKPYSRSRLISDLVNSIGACVVAGNSRRSATICLGKPTDKDFLSLKDLSKNPERKEISWMSNNSIVLESSADFQCLPDIAKEVQSIGEPGIVNLINIKKWGKYGKRWDDTATGINPCILPSATLLTPNGIRTLSELSIGDTVWSGNAWTKIINKWSTGIKPVFEYKTTAGSFISTEDHRILCDGEKIKVKEAESIDIAKGEEGKALSLHPVNKYDVMDGLVLGDGMVHKASNNLVLLCIGAKDKDYLESEVSFLIKRERKGIGPYAWEINTSVTHDELPKTYEREIPERFFKGDSTKVASFLRGFYSANGSVISNRITLKATSFKIIRQIQQMLSSLGISSYHTTNKETEVEFDNGTYVCKKSYDLNITGDRDIFARKIGFIQGYKTEKLNAIIGKESRIKKSYEIREIVPLGEHEVFDITVDCPEHTFWCYGFLTSNCGETPLEDKELCCLAEVFPTRCQNDDEFFKACEFATFYASTISLLPSHDERTNKVVERNRRIGVSISGIQDWISKAGMAKTIRLMRTGYDLVRAINLKLAVEAHVNQSIRTTVIKPSGTITNLVGCTPGIHFPTFQHALRRMRVGVHTPFNHFLIDNGFYYEKDEYSDDTNVFEFPIKYETPRTEETVSVWEQASMLSMAQREWADNAVSVTLKFDPTTEASDIEHLLSSFAPITKSISMLPHTPEGVYKQSPYTKLSLEEYERRVKEMPTVDWNSFTGGDGADERFCDSNSCSI